jgi:2-polyprenyl-3-methyl-5-hydroxy-6-metoxy-1,4-benzoquinol methylase
MHAKSHWNQVYTTKPANAVSWFQEHADASLDIIRRTGAQKDAHIIDVGGGASTLVDDLLREGYSNLTVLDLSATALQAAQTRLGELAKRVQWLEADITDARLPVRQVDIWHDRAVFHFLTRPEERAAYVANVMRAVRPDGHVIVATFAEDGPTQCSGLPVVRYSADQLHDEFGAAFQLVAHAKETHMTPFGTQQQFVYCYCRKTMV